MIVKLVIEAFEGPDDEGMYGNSMWAQGVIISPEMTPREGDQVLQALTHAASMTIRHLRAGTSELLDKVIKDPLSISKEDAEVMHKVATAQ